ncbi:hypothetical protein EGJ27_21130 [Pseudomonas sp. v388]|uniref:hypothetical protein n=1 Tax=Pseudomonas sp. v388 TaxID=2479849 RepID=UPI000F7ABD49|nr:hypothetical protein [Pseudomonas sp. v388]RRV04976.1 hypothetical protein EGJ27_21130 [Pseudomonas sp. v388]
MQLIKNGNFSHGFKSWQGPEGFKPDFQPHGNGQSLRLPAGTLISQSLPDLPGKTLRIEFDVRSADPLIPEARFTVSVGGFTADGTAQVSPIPGMATRDWQRLSVRLYFLEALSLCFINVTTPRPADAQGELGPVRFADFTLTQEEPS